MSTEPRRLAVVLARHSAAAATPAGVDRSAFARVALADTYEVVSDLLGVDAGIAGPPEVADLLWPGDLCLPDRSILELAAQVTRDYDELVFVAADAPDLPGLVLAKMFKVLHRMDLVVAPERGGPGCVAIGLSLPTAPWLPDLELDRDPTAELPAAADRRRVSRSPDWHRLRHPTSLARLDPGLEGWDQTRLLLAEPR